MNRRRSPPARVEDAPPGAEDALKQARERLEDREARLNAILDTAVDGIITIDESGIIESVNAATQRIFGYQPDELLGQNVRLLMPEPDRSRHDGYLSRYLQTGEARIIGIGRETEALRKDGTRFPIDLAVSQFYSGGRRLFTGMVRDISDRRRAEEEARRRREELSHAARLSTIGELSSGIAHEINQPLTAIVSFSEACLRMLRSGDSDSDKLENVLEQIAAQGQRAGQITRQLRRLARKAEREHEQVDINRMVCDVLALVKNELETSNIALHLDFDESLPPVECNRIQLEQVVLNLVRNAMDALADVEPLARELSVRTGSGSDSGIVLEVEDSGGGLGDSGPERVFETFFTTKPDGLGMGLAISRTMIEDHGGRLWASQGAGGAVFHVAIPIHGRAAS
ncbi:MAG: PAS domain S-box protein [Gammaproteobacteria bacterium]|nr:PAS domain S-box protein [Gammaproteobacteria bacterium]NIM72589.1 PAS domain S-box protein [Gammaproteobacteria bacterium]NIN37646.1 PAS domain S-box protein [Gammaproteobacteria bacterium]NIO24350.1 PAS domain S-box protein [Gammaproteobacteria bacterium]NIO64953.1 PAS domain S-box protein [Gammaproteobacteria bacterium]